MPPFWLVSGRAESSESSLNGGPCDHVAPRGSLCSRRLFQDTVSDAEDLFARVLLEVLEELRRPVVGSRTRPARIWPCAQNLSQRSRTAVLAKKCRDSAARAASRFGPMLANTFERGLRRGYRKASDTRVELAALIAAAAWRCFSGLATAKFEWLPAAKPRKKCTALEHVVTHPESSGSSARCRAPPR